MSTETDTQPEQTALAPELKQGAPIGNTNAVKHGLTSRSKSVLRLRSRRVTSRMRKAWGVYPWLDKAKDEPDVRLWATLLVMTEDIGDTVINLGMWSRVEGQDLIPRHLLKSFNSLVSQRLTLEDRLGITYASRRAFGLGSGIKGKGLAEAIAEEDNEPEVIEADGYRID